MSSGWLTRVARPAQYTEARVDTPTAPSASANRMVVPTGTSSPAPRSTRAKPTAKRSSPIEGVIESVTSGTALRGPFGRAAHQLLDPGRPRALLVLAVLEDRAQRDLDRVLVDGGASERGERVRPVDRLGDARRLVELEVAHGFHRGRDLARELVGHLRCTNAEDGELALEIRMRDPVVEAAALERVVDIARSVRRHHHERRYRRMEGAELG